VASCAVGAARPEAGDTLSAYTTAPVDATHAPEATNAAERFVFAQVYETLIDLDCQARARPALAASWTFDATKTRIALTLRDNARFSTGRAVTAGDVLAAWRATAERPTPGARLARAIAGGTTVIDDRRLVVSLPDTAWAVLASDALAVYETPPSGAWPAGTGSYRVVAAPATAPPGVLALASSSATSNSHLLIRRSPSDDVRDAIDAGADVVVTNDPLAVRYAASRATLAVVPLPWSHTYALALSGPAPSALSAVLAGDSTATAFRESLARDAVRAEAGGTQPPWWWDVGGQCVTPRDSLPPSPAANSRRSNRVVYRRDDPVARGLAERLVALDPRSVATSLAADDFSRALRGGGDLAYVMDLPRLSLAPCHEYDALLSSAPWLDDAGAALVPLVDTRETAIVNRARVSATTDWRGTLHVRSPSTSP
jgi:hypothetical protein